MSLFIVATPIGSPLDISENALQILKQSDIIIVEEFKESSKTLRYNQITGKQLEQLNEHTTPDDILRLAEFCKTKIVSLISDCGTPGFCDPGPLLIDQCRKNNTDIKPILGASSLMGLLCMSSQRLDQFIFRGFLPAENEARQKELLSLTKEKRAIIIMDTPYRLKKTMDDMAQHFNNRKILLAMNISQESEKFLEGYPESLKSQAQVKSEFMILIYPSSK